MAYDLSEYPSPFIKDGKFNGLIVVGDKAPAGDVVIVANLIPTFQFPILGSDPESVSAIDTILENHTKTYTINGLDYEIALSYIDNHSAQFKVNGRSSPLLLFGDGFDLPDGKRITLADLFFENGKHSATFFFGRKKINVEKTIVEFGSAMLGSEVRDIKSVNSIIIGNACDNPLILEVRGSKSGCNSGYKQGIGSIESYQFDNGKVSIIITGYSANDISAAARVLQFYGYYKSFFKGSKIFITGDNGKITITPDAKEKNDLKKNPDLKSAKNDLSDNNFKFWFFAFIFLIILLAVLIRLGKQKNKRGKI